MHHQTVTAKKLIPMSRWFTHRLDPFLFFMKNNNKTTAVVYTHYRQTGSHTQTSTTRRDRLAAKTLHVLKNPLILLSFLFLLKRVCLLYVCSVYRYNTSFCPYCTTRQSTRRGQRMESVVFVIKKCV